VDGRDREGVPYVTEDNAGLLREAGGTRPTAGADDLPVVGVSWQGAIAYGRWLSSQTGRDYRLPTEAEWERAARAGSAGTWPWGEAAPAGQLNCGGADGRLAAVGSYAANAYGVFDLLGNAWEWTLDCFALDFYFYSPTHDPRLLDPACLTPGIRGGSFRDSPEMCRPGYRVNFWWRGAPSIGFRVVRGGPLSR
jgi:formylglycine-generating enzyme required for sulfatase activity